MKHFFKLCMKHFSRNNQELVLIKLTLLAICNQCKIQSANAYIIRQYNFFTWMKHEGGMH